MKLLKYIPEIKIQPNIREPKKGDKFKWMNEDDGYDYGYNIQTIANIDENIGYGEIFIKSRNLDIWSYVLPISFFKQCVKDKRIKYL